MFTYGGEAQSWSTVITTAWYENVSVGWFVGFCSLTQCCLQFVCLYLTAELVLLHFLFKHSFCVGLRSHIAIIKMKELQLTQRLLQTIEYYFYYLTSSWFPAICFISRTSCTWHPHPSRRPGQATAFTHSSYTVVNSTKKKLNLWVQAPVSLSCSIYSQTLFLSFCYANRRLLCSDCE